MDETTLKIGGLLEIAEAQQQAITAQLERLEQQTAALTQATAQVNAAREQALNALQEAAGAAIRDGVRDALSQTAKTALAALEGVSEPVTARWAAMTQEAQAAEIIPLLSLLDKPLILRMPYQPRINNLSPV